MYNKSGRRSYLKQCGKTNQIGKNCLLLWKRSHSRRCESWVDSTQVTGSKTNSDSFSGCLCDYVIIWWQHLDGRTEALGNMKETVRGRMMPLLPLSGEIEELLSTARQERPNPDSQSVTAAPHTFCSCSLWKTSGNLVRSGFTLKCPKSN